MQMFVDLLSFVDLYLYKLPAQLHMTGRVLRRPSVNLLDYLLVTSTATSQEKISLNSYGKVTQ